MAATSSLLADRLSAVRQRIADAATAAGRDPNAVRLVAVTKYAAPEQIREALALGVGDVGENRVQQLVQRAAQLGEFHQRRAAAGEDGYASKLNWHMVGRLQRSNVKQLLPHCDLIHSVDSLRLAEEIDAQAEKIGKVQNILLQVNCSEEDQKGGVAVGAAVPLAESIASIPHVRLLGLMTMAKLDASADETRTTFRRLREIFEEMKFEGIAGDNLRHLSMGMSNDLEHAIAEGSTMVRVGSDIFGSDSEENAE
ncbi:MAG: YggS family pyridoxal phosphate-dependent enzyme [Planctomycetota bacterium]